MGRGALGFFRLRQALGVSARRASAVAPSASAPSLCLFASWPLRFLRQARRSTARRSLRLRGNAGSWRPWGVRTFTVRAFSAPSDRTQGSCDRLQESSHLARARARSGTQEENGTQERTQERNETRPVFEVERSPLPRRIASLHENRRVANAPDSCAQVIRNVAKGTPLGGKSAQKTQKTQTKHHPALRGCSGFSTTGA